MAANPFEVDGVWLKCALHTHSTVSDGDLAPEALLAEYATAGFDVVAITDHWRLTAVHSSSSLLAVPAAELTCDIERPGMTCDVLVYGLREIPEDPGGDRRNWMTNDEEHWEQRTFPDLTSAGRFAEEQGAVAYLAHPYWTGMDARPLIEAEHIRGVEVYNASGEVECGRGDSSMVWDAALGAGKALFGIATDDTHVAGLDIGRAWTWVHAEDQSVEAVVDALRSGRLYSSSGPTLESVIRQGSSVEVVCSPCRALVLQMEREMGCSVVAGDRGPRNGKVLATSELGLITRAVVEWPWKEPEPRYVRLRAIDAEGYSAWTGVL
jgi:predicted metal-dependent phosphoesterase TrpH